MNRKKLLAVIISLVLAIAVVLPGTLAISADQDSSQSTLSVDTEPTPSEPETPAEPEPSAPGEQPADETPEQPAEEPTADENPEQPAEETPADPVTPAYSAHIDGCSDACPGENCPCGCHLFAKIMACQTLDEIWAIMDHMTDAQWNSISDAQYAAIDSLIASLDAAQIPAPPEADNNPQIESEIIYPTVTYTYVAPLGDPVIGGQG